MPPTPGIGFVVVTHHHTTKVSLLPELLRRRTQLEVDEATDGLIPLPDHIYVSPPGKLIRLGSGKLRLEDAPRDQLIPLPIDCFFRSLAEDRGVNAAGVVLSGTGADGTLGLRAIKGAAGLTLAQDLKSAAFSGMPGNAIGSGDVDYVLEPVAMAETLVRYFRDRPHPMAATAQEGDEGQLDMEQVLIAVRSRTGHDFSG